MSLYGSSVPHYLIGRPPYSRHMAETLRRELRLDGTGVLLDVGCGPGIVAVELAGEFESVFGLDPEPAMLDEARRHATDRGVTNVQWINRRAEDIPSLAFPAMRVVTFAQSLRWTDRDRVLDIVYELLEPGGSVVLIAHDVDTRPPPVGPGDPLIPHAEIQRVIDRYVGPDRPGKGRDAERFEETLARSRFASARSVHAPGREDVTRDIDGVISGFLSMSYASPTRLGDRFDAFTAELQQLLEARTTSGRFWDWPGDTALIIGTKPLA